jgi:hypothetical protein
VLSAIDPAAVQRALTGRVPAHHQARRERRARPARGEGRQVLAVDGMNRPGFSGGGVPRFPGVNSTGDSPVPRLVLVGELGLDGSVRGIRGVRPAVLAAARAGHPQWSCRRPTPRRAPWSTAWRCSWHTSARSSLTWPLLVSMSSDEVDGAQVGTCNGRAQPGMQDVLELRNTKKSSSCCNGEPGQAIRKHSRQSGPA